MKILITGGAGFIGSNLCEYFLKNTQHTIYCIDNLFSSSKSKIEHFIKSKRFYFIKVDITKYKFPSSFYVDEIYHLACPASPPIYQKDPIFTLNTNVLGTINVLEFAKKCNAKILLASTSEVYGDPLISPQDEKYKGNVNCVGKRSCYDVGKRIAETYFIEYHRKHNINIRIARIFNTYGPNLNPCDGRVISNFLKQALSNKDLTIYGDGKQTRSFCYVDDLINGFIGLMKSNYHYPVNLGNEIEITILKLAEIMITLTGSKSKITYKELPEDDPRVRKPDLTLARKLFSYCAKTPLEEGLKKMLF